MKAPAQTLRLRIGAADARHAGAAAERGDVVGGVARAAWQDLGRVVLEDQHGRLARHARHFAVDELIGNQVADDQQPAAAEAVDEVEQALFALGLARQRMNGTRDQQFWILKFSNSQISDSQISLSIQLEAAIRLS